MTETEERSALYSPDDLPAKWAARISVETNGCWRWIGMLRTTGYGEVQLPRKGMRPITVAAHRWVYEQLVGPIPDGLVMDHFKHPQDGCIGRPCVRPDHLKPTTHADNITRPGSLSITAAQAAQTHCKHGHEFTPENTAIDRYKGKNARACRTCHAESNRRGRRAAKLAAAAALSPSDEKDGGASDHVLPLPGRWARACRLRRQRRRVRLAWRPLRLGSHLRSGRSRGRGRGNGLAAQRRSPRFLPRRRRLRRGVGMDGERYMDRLGNRWAVYGTLTGLVVGLVVVGVVALWGSLDAAGIVSFALVAPLSWFGFWFGGERAMRRMYGRPTP